MMNDDDCGVISGMIGRGTEVFAENLPRCHTIHDVTRAAIRAAAIIDLK
jgi:hypothetical protein